MTESSFSDRFAQHLRNVLEQPGRARAVLRRSLSSPPGESVAAIPYVEPFVATADKWTRKCAYLVAGVNAASGIAVGAGSMGAAAARLLQRTDSKSVETRFLALLDADEEQLAYRLRQMIVLMAGNEIAPDWARLFRDLRRWMAPDRHSQISWARDFYALGPKTANESEDNDASGIGQEGTSGNPDETKED